MIMFTQSQQKTLYAMNIFVSLFSSKSQSVKG